MIPLIFFVYNTLSQTPFQENFIISFPSNKNIQEDDLSQITQRVYDTMLLTTQSQTVIFRGRSQSGKTPISRQLIRSLSSIKKSGESKFSNETIHYAFLILDSVLGIGESGCLKVGTSTELHFNYVGEPVALRISPFGIPQKMPCDSSCTFSIFYQMLAGLSQTEMSDLSLVYKDYTKYSFLPQIEKTPDASEWNNLVVAMLFLRFSQQQIRTIKRILASILQLSLIQFSKNLKPSASLPYSIVPSNMVAIDSICNNLGISENELVSLLVSPENTTKSMSHRGMTITRRSTVADIRIPLNEADAIKSRNDFANFLYSQLAHFVINTLNSKAGSLIHKSAFYVDVVDFPGLDMLHKDSLNLLRKISFFFHHLFSVIPLFLFFSFFDCLTLLSE